MQGLPFVLLFTALTFLSWGAYGPLLRYGTTAMGHDGLKAFVGVGLAYFVIAVIVPFWILQKKGEKGKWTVVGTTYSIVAGSVGAIGALGIILALVFKGDPVFVMPLVFGFAPIVNTLVTAWMGGNLNKIKPVFVGGIVAAALGASGVLYFKPSTKPAALVTKVSSENTEANAEASAEPHVEPAIEKTVPKAAERTPVPAANSEKAPAHAPVSESPKPTEPIKPSVPDKVEQPAKVVEAKPLFAAQPDAGSPPLPDKLIVASRPSDGQPPVPEKLVSPLIAAKPEEGQPPVPEKPAPEKTLASVPTGSPNLPPPVVNPEDDSVSALPTKPSDADKAPTQTEPPKDSTKELPPPVPNPEDDLSSDRPARRIHSRFVSTAEQQATESTDDAAEEKNADEKTTETAHDVTHAAAPVPNTGMIALSILMAALCWGSYGPMLHQGQMKMGGSRLRPFACVGIAYFIIAVAVPLVLLYTTPTISHGDWTVKGLFWSIIAGGAGAIGALGIILAFNAGGKPIYVMPLVFGFAPVINTFISLTEAGAWSKVETMFWVSLGVVIAGAITVLITAPKAAHGPAHAPAPAGVK